MILNFDTFVKESNSVDSAEVFLNFIKETDRIVRSKLSDLCIITADGSFGIGLSINPTVSKWIVNSVSDYTVKHSSDLKSTWSRILELKSFYLPVSPRSELYDNYFFIKYELKNNIFYPVNYIRGSYQGYSVLTINNSTIDHITNLAKFEFKGKNFVSASIARDNHVDKKVVQQMTSLSKILPSLDVTNLRGAMLSKKLGIGFIQR